MQLIASKAISGLAVILLCLPPPDALAADASLATEWNDTVLGIAEAEDGFMTLKGLRTVTMMHIAMHDALSAINGPYETYAYEASEVRADPVAAAVQAAFAVAANQYPDQRQRLAAMRDRWLSDLPPGELLQAGLETGNAAADAILARRDDDGWDRNAEYRWHPMAPGVYAEFQEHSGTPQGFIFGAGWANARGFALQRPDQFRAPPPPEISSDAYTQAFNEVKALGRFQSMSRTPDQTHIALWWKDFAENSHNRLARDLIDKEDLPLQQAVRLLALLNMAIFDGYVSSFENKFYYNHWRPYTAIRWAANDGNSDTEPEETWTNTHRHTYAFPSYPSAHGTACAAAMTAFEAVFGDDYAFTMRIPMVDVAGPFSGKIEMHPPTRGFENFSEAAMQCGLSRIYLGIHFRYDSVEGVQLGEVVGKNVVDNHLRPVKLNGRH
ncbi:MAG: vanadium-dependent haloperoxidase [Woeseiaceae bacterium]|nr:vanadium-dependent haloperoxidase [Woeseiaceae bacterium]